MISNLDTDLASKYLDQHGVELVNALGGWVDAHPRIIVGIAILAAAAAIVADMDIPELKHRFKLSDEWAIKLGANIGSFQNITLKKIEAELEHKSGPLVAAVKLARFDCGLLWFELLLPVLWVWTMFMQCTGSNQRKLSGRVGAQGRTCTRSVS